MRVLFIPKQPDALSRCMKYIFSTCSDVIQKEGTIT